MSTPKDTLPRRLIGEEALQRRIAELAGEIDRDYRDKSPVLCIAGGQDDSGLHWPLRSCIRVGEEATFKEAGRQLAASKRGVTQRHDVANVTQDRIARPEDDAWNRRVLGLLEAGRVAEFEGLWGEFAAEAKADMGFKHFAFLLGAMGGGFRGAEVLGYAPTHGAGAAAIAFELDEA